MAMALAGGAADKLGNGYERRFTVLAMIDILMGRADSLRVEVPGDAGAGAEFRLRAGSSCEWTQSKRQKSTGAWTVNSLLKEKFLQGWLPKLQAGDTCTFSSTTSADELRQLCGGARDAIDREEFEAEFLKSGRRKKFEILKTAWGGIGSDEAHQLLRLIKVDTIDDERLDQQIDTSLLILVSGNVKAARRVLLQYADEIIHQEISADDIWDFLQDNGIEKAGRIVSTPSSTPASSEDRWLSERLDRLPVVVHGRIRAAVATDERSARRLVRLLTDEQTPKAVLTEWKEQRPAWLAQSDWDTQLATAELAGAYGVHGLQAEIFSELVEQGFPPKQLWTARTVFTLTSAGDPASSAEVLAQALPSGLTEHPYARAVAALFESRPNDALQEIQAWTPDDPADRAAKALLSVQIALGNPNDEAIEPEAFQQALSMSKKLLEEEWLGSIALWRARMLTLRARQRGSKILFGDLREAQELALRVRDDQRRFRGDSAAAAAASCEAAGIRGDLDFVLRTGLPADLGGSATAEEFQHSDVAQQVALAALQLRRFDIAELATANVTSAFHRKLIEALSAQVRREDSTPFWREAVELATDNYTYLVQALSGLARTGAANLPRLEDLQEIHPQAAAEIQATAEIHAGNYDRSIASLRIQRHESITAAMTLAEAYGSIGETDSAAETLLDAADDFNDPHLRLQAAMVLAGAGRTERASSLVATLIRSRDHDWPEFIDVLKFAAQLALDEPNLDLAIAYSRQILQENPSDSSTRWVLINSLMILDYMTDAWEVMRTSPVQLQPETRTHAQMWAELHRRFADPATTIRGCLDLLRKFRGDEEVSAFILWSIMMQKPTDDPVPAELLGEYHQELESFFDQWPESPRLRRIRTDDDELLIKALTDSLRPTPERLAERNRLTRQFYRGEKPLILLAEYTGRTYCDVLIRRGTGVLPMVNPDPHESLLCRETVRNSANRDVAIDASGIVVLSTLPAEFRDAALAVFRRGITTDEVARDARQYDETLSRQSGALYYNADADAPGLTELTEEQVTAARASLMAAQSLITRLRREPIRPDVDHERLRLNVHASVVQLSVSKRVAVWCDDSAARVVMRTLGVPTFSTLAVLEHLLTQGILSAAGFDAVLDTFIEERIGIPNLELSRIVKIARQEDWQAANAASTLMQAQAWVDIAETTTLTSNVLRTCHREKPDQVAAWLYAAVFGSVMHCPNTRAAIEIGSLLLAGNLLSLCARGQSARDMVSATRDAVRAALPVDNPANISTDPLSATARHMRTLLLRDSGVSADHVFPSILDCFSELGDQDLRTVTEALLAKDD